MASTLSTEETEQFEPVLGELVAEIDWRFFGLIIALFTLFVVIFATIQFASPAIVGNDGYYHIRFADIMRHEGLMPRFKWLPRTILNEESYYDHHMLYHVALALFIPGEPRSPVPDETLVSAAKWASVIFPALAFMAIWYMLYREGIRWSWLWALALFAVSDAFLYRMSMVRAQSVSLMLLALGLHWLLRRRFIRLLPLGLVFVWTYNAFPLLLLVAAVVVIATYLTEKRFEPWALIFPAGGISLGLIVNPYFPQNMIFIYRHLLPKLGENINGLGIEWEPYETWTLVSNSTVMFIMLALAIFALGWGRRKMDRSTLAAFGLTLVFGLMMMKSRRFVEYAPAFVLIFTALASRPLLDRWAVDKEDVHIAVVGGLLALALLPALGRSVLRARDQVDTSRPSAYMAAGVRWLRDNTPPGSMIFQTDWDDFTRLYFYDTKDVYLVGLDPTYLQIADPVLYDEWVSITRGHVRNPGAAIRDHFGGQYVFTDTDHTAFIDLAADDPLLAEVYRDEDVVIYAVDP
jgi:asparagine N-glycosylation enzyme membrane subunit Stt3